MGVTSLGLKAALFWTLIQTAFFVSPYSNLFFLLLAFLTVVLVLNTWWTAFNLRGVTARIDDLETIAANGSSTVGIQIEARPRPRFHVSVVLSVRRPGERRSTTKLAEVAWVKGTATVEGQLPELQRGRYRTLGLWLQSSYPLGLLRRRVALPSRETLYVHAEPLTELLRVPRDRLLDSLGEDLHGGKLDLGPSGLRDYRPGDSPREIHWKASARRQQLVVKELDGEGAAGIEVALDRRCTPEQLEHALRIVATLAIRAKEDKRPVAVTTQGLAETFGEGHRSLTELLTWTAEAAVLEPGAEGLPPLSPAVMRLPNHPEPEVAR